MSQYLLHIPKTVSSSIGDELNIGIEEAHDEITQEVLDCINEDVSEKIKLIKRYEKTNISEGFIDLVDRTKEYVSEISGISKENTPEIIIVDKKYYNDISRLTSDSFDSDKEETGMRLGYYSSRYNASFIFYSPSYGYLETLHCICHEMLHSIGIKARSIEIESGNNLVLETPRMGFYLHSLGKNFGLVLEEGIVEYYSIKFIDSIKGDKIFQNDSFLRDTLSEKIQKVDDFKKMPLKYGIANYGQLRIYDSPIDNLVVTIDRKISKILGKNHLLFSWFPLIFGKLYGLGPQSFSAVLIETILERFEGKDKGDLEKLFLDARINLGLTSKLAKAIDSKWGKGTYIQIKSCPYEAEEIGLLIEALQNKQK